MSAHKGQLTRVPLPNNRRHSPQPAGVGGESTKPAARSAAETMRDTLRTAAGHAVYEMRTAVGSAAICEASRSEGAKRSRPNDGLCVLPATF